MHDTALEYCNLFFDAYLGQQPQTIIELGSQDVNGSVRAYIPPQHTYVGLDFVAGQNVDVLLTDAYNLPLADNSADICISTSCLEHAEFFWLSFLELMRILKPSGILYLNSPSNGKVHRHPMDCWRFYPDSGLALQHWAERNGLNSALLESFTGVQKSCCWNDWIAVFIKDRQFKGNHPRRMLHSLKEFTNGYIEGEPNLLNPAELTEDQRHRGKFVYRQMVTRGRQRLGSLLRKR